MENVKRKQKRKPLPKKTALLLLLSALIIIGALAYIFREAPPSLPPVESAAAVMLLPRGVEEISSVTITPREEDGYTLVLGEDGFHISGHEEDAIRSIILNELNISCGHLPAEATILADFSQYSGAASDFGLNPAWATVEIIYQDGESLSLWIGDLAPNEETPQRYCRVEGDPALYTLLSADAAAFGYSRDALRDFAQPALDGSLLDKITVTGDTDFSVSYTPSGWQMETPCRYPAEETRMNALLSKIESMRFEACLGSAEETDLSSLGLLHPALTVTLDQAATVISGETAEGEQITYPVNARQFTLSLGDETGKSGVYALWNGQVFKASNFLFGFWKELSPRDYLIRKPVNFLINNLSRVSFSAGEIHGAYEVRMVESITENNQIAVDEYGRVLYDCAVRREGESSDMDAKSFLDWYTSLAALSADGDLPTDYALPSTPRAAIQIENETLKRLIEFYPFDALHDAVAVDGVALFYIQKSRVDSVMQLP